MLSGLGLGILDFYLTANDRVSELSFPSLVPDDNGIVFVSLMTLKGALGGWPLPVFRPGFELLLPSKSSRAAVIVY